jgi:hypothetical protein
MLLQKNKQMWLLEMRVQLHQRGCHCLGFLTAGRSFKQSCLNSKKLLYACNNKSQIYQARKAAFKKKLNHHSISPLMVSASKMLCEANKCWTSLMAVFATAVRFETGLQVWFCRQRAVSAPLLLSCSQPSPHLFETTPPSHQGPSTAPLLPGDMPSKRT